MTHHGIGSTGRWLVLAGALVLGSSGGARASARTWPVPAAPQETPEPARQGAEGPGSQTQEQPPSAAGEAEPESTDEATPTPSTPPPPAARYRSPEEAEQLLAGWLGSGLAERVELPVSRGGHALLAVQFGAPGPTPLAERTTVLLLGGLDGISLAGSQAVIAVVDACLASPERLPEGVTFLALPWANPDALVRRLGGGIAAGCNDRPIDDDGDGVVDEDGPDDLDGDGMVLDLLVEDPSGPWVRPQGERFLRPARPGEAPRYRRVPEGRDDDGDGRFNEDPVGGVSLDHNFPLDWRGPWTGVRSGPSPLSEPTSAAIAQLALSRRLAVALLFQGNHGKLASPGSLPRDVATLALPLAADEPAYRALREAHELATGRPQGSVLRLADLHADEPGGGAAVDWFYAALGALSAEVAVWGPEVDTVAAERQGRALPGGGSLRAGGSLSPQPSEAGFLELGQEDAWGRWLDEARGGLGFVEWQPVDLGGGRTGLVGGWQPFTCLNPPAELLPAALAGLDDFVLDVASRLPRLDVEVVEQSRSGRVALLRARVRNLGGLPSGVGPRGARTDARMRLELSAGVELLAGEREQDLGHLPAQGKSETFDWLLMAPADTVFSFVVESPWGTPVSKEIRL